MSLYTHADMIVDNNNLQTPAGSTDSASIDNNINIDHNMSNPVVSSNSMSIDHNTLPIRRDLAFKTGSNTDYKTSNAPLQSNGRTADTVMHNIATTAVAAVNGTGTTTTNNNKTTKIQTPRPIQYDINGTVIYDGHRICTSNCTAVCPNKRCEKHTLSGTPCQFACIDRPYQHTDTVKLPVNINLMHEYYTAVNKIRVETAKSTQSDTGTIVTAYKPKPPLIQYDSNGIVIYDGHTMCSSSCSKTCPGARCERHERRRRVCPFTCTDKPYLHTDLAKLDINQKLIQQYIMVRTDAKLHLTHKTTTDTDIIETPTIPTSLQIRAQVRHFINVNQKRGITLLGIDQCLQLLREHFKYDCTHKRQFIQQTLDDDYKLLAQQIVDTMDTRLVGHLRYAAAILTNHIDTQIQPQAYECELMKLCVRRIIRIQNYSMLNLSLLQHSTQQSVIELNDTTVQFKEEYVFQGISDELNALELLNSSDLCKVYYQTTTPALLLQRFNDNALYTILNAFIEQNVSRSQYTMPAPTDAINFLYERYSLTRFAKLNDFDWRVSCALFKSYVKVLETFKVQDHKINVPVAVVDWMKQHTMKQQANNDTVNNAHTSSNDSALDVSNAMISDNLTSNATTSISQSLIDVSNNIHTNNNTTNTTKQSSIKWSGISPLFISDAMSTRFYSILCELQPPITIHPYITVLGYTGVYFVDLHQVWRTVNVAGNVDTVHIADWRTLLYTIGVKAYRDLYSYLTLTTNLSVNQNLETHCIEQLKYIYSTYCTTVEQYICNQILPAANRRAFNINSGAGPSATIEILLSLAEFEYLSDLYRENTHINAITIASNHTYAMKLLRHTCTEIDSTLNKLRRDANKKHAAPNNRATTSQPISKPIKTTIQSVKQIHQSTVIDSDGHESHCTVCGSTGDLILCDNCPRVMHLHCIELDHIPDGQWYCHICTETVQQKIYNDMDCKVNKSNEQKYHFGDFTMYCYPAIQ